MAHQNDDQILIAGGGPAGLAAALFLDEQSIDVELIDPRERTTDDERAIVLRRETVGLLAQHGVVFDPSEARVIASVAVYQGPSGRDTERLDPREADGLVMPRYLLCKKLCEALRARDVRVMWNHRLARLDVFDHRVEIDIEGLGVDVAGYATLVHERIVESTGKRTPPYLIAADGGESIVRLQLRIPWHPLGEPRRITSFELATEHDAGDAAHLIVGDVSTELWPLAGHRLAMYTIGGDGPLHDPPDLEDARALLDAHAPGIAPTITAVRRARVQTIAPGFAEPWHVGPVWLLGGAARVLPEPAYSADRSVRDAHRLALAFGQAIRTLQPPEQIVANGL